MRFDEASRVSHPAALVLETMIERMEAIVPFLPNIDSIDTQAVEKLEDGRMRIVRRWQGASQDVPAAIRPFVSREMMAWIDTAVWTLPAYKADWVQSSVSAKVAKLYSCKGASYFEPDPEAPDTATRVRITGELTIHPDQLPGVPFFLGKRLAPQIEKFIINMITPNLTSLGAGLQGYLDRQHAAGGGQR